MFICKDILQIHRNLWFKFKVNCLYKAPPFAKAFLDFIMNNFGWSLALPNDIWSLLNITIFGHPLNNEKEISWLNFIRAFHWSFRKIEFRASPLTWQRVLNLLHLGFFLQLSLGVNWFLPVVIMFYALSFLHGNSFL